MDSVILMLAFVGITYIVIFLLGERTPDFTISSNNFLEYINKNEPIIIDLRESDEVSEFQLPYQSVIHHPFLSLQKDISQLNIDSTLTYLLICNDGNRSRLISSYLASQGITIPYLQDGLRGVPETQIKQLQKSE